MNKLKVAAISACLLFSNIIIAQQKEISVDVTNSVKCNDGLSDRIIEKTTKVFTKAGQTFSNIIEKYSGMMQVSPSSITNVVLYQFIDEWYGTHYRMGGMGKGGIDCSALVQKLYSYVYGMDLVRTSVMQFRSSEFIAKMENLKEGDLVFFKIHGGPVSHVGVYLNNGHFVHASSSKGVMISNLSDTYWTRYYVGGGRVR